jgi:glycosyltransferase involved in cell wall biosynthesis
MPSDFTVVVATYGSRKWQLLAHRRAIPSARGQAPVEYVHGPSLHEARNQGLERVRTEFVVFLDADDELAPGYIDAMAQASGDLRAPRVQRVRRFGRADEPFTMTVYGHHHECTGECLREGNFLVIGTAVRTELASEVGGFEPWEFTEDRAFFARCWLAGGQIEHVPGAVYRAHVRNSSRNTEGTPLWKDARSRELEAAVFGQGVAHLDRR